MKKYIFYFLIFAVLASQQTFAGDMTTNEWGIATNGVQMSIRLKDESKIKVNQPFDLWIQIKDTSTNEMFHGYYTYYNDYGLSFVVIAPSGEDVSPKFSKESVNAVSGASIMVPPNQIRKFQFNLSYLCKFNQIGTYKVIAKQKGYLGKRGLTVVSNPLCVTVISDKQ